MDGTPGCKTWTPQTFRDKEPEVRTALVYGKTVPPNIIVHKDTPAAQDTKHPKQSKDRK
jgi:hypothetical protein